MDSRFRGNDKGYMLPSEEIKSRIDIVDIIREYIPVKAAGANFRAKCPFHNEKTPSLMISPDKQIWHCFGCGKGGDIFAFITEIEGIDFSEALRLLAPKAGVTLKRQDPEVTSIRNKLMDIIDLSRRYYHKVLLETKPAEAARRYLESRKLTRDTIEEWQIGYSFDDWDNLNKFLKNKKYNDKEIFLAGMSAQSSSGNRFYDRFRGRIMFPINDVNGNTVAFTARISPEKEQTEKMGKYINSPQTQIYDKSKILFGLDKAKMEIKRMNLAIIVEGQMDVITAHQSGFKNVVASSGTALTQEQIILLKRYTNNIALAFDMDEAGQMAADRGAREAMVAEMSIKVIEVPAGKDPDECIKNDPDSWKIAVEKAKPLMEYYFDKTFSKLNLEKIDDRRQAAKILLTIISRLGNRIEQDFWIKTLGERIDVEESILRETLAKAMRKEESASSAQDKPRVTQKQERIKGRNEKLSELLLALVIKFPSTIEYIISHLQVNQLIGAENQALYKNLIFYYNNLNNIEQEIIDRESGEAVNYFSFRKWLENETVNQDNITEESQPRLLDRLAILGDKEFFNLDIDKSRNEVIKIIIDLKKYYLNNRKKEVEKLVAIAEKNKNTNDARNLIEELKVLSDELQEISKTI